MIKNSYSVFPNNRKERGVVSTPFSVTQPVLTGCDVNRVEIGNMVKQS